MKQFNYQYYTKSNSILITDDESNIITLSDRLNTLNVKHIAIIYDSRFVFIDKRFERIIVVGNIIDTDELRIFFTGLNENILDKLFKNVNNKIADDILYYDSLDDLNTNIAEIHADMIVSKL